MMMNHEIKAEWEHDVTERCPYCGSKDIDWVESDDGIGLWTWDKEAHCCVHDGDNTHWFVWLLSCCNCEREWYIEYEMVNPRIYGKER